MKKVDIIIENTIYAIQHTKDPETLIPALMEQYHFSEIGAKRFIKNIQQLEKSDEAPRSPQTGDRD